MATAFKQPAPPVYIDPATVPDIYAAKGVGTCLEPVIADGTMLVFDRREEAKPGDFVGIWLRPEKVRPGEPQQIVKRLVSALPPIPLPYVADLSSNAVPIVVVEMLNPRRTMWLKATDILAVHRRVGVAEVTPDGGARFNRKTGGF